MTNKSEVLDDSKTVIDSPPPYNSVYESTSAELVKCPNIRPYLFSFLRNNHKKTMILSSIRDIVSASDSIPSSDVAPIVDACAAAISPTTSCKNPTSKVTRRCIGQL
ncbi:hypothetical protein BDR07DRAFT_1613826 [Suillus spraguei]|nr:hypothetical protein BDR07DRAFT_1613826 [Suillus spraguei]